jgi:hypothetical protein
MHFEIVGEVTEVEPIAVGRTIRDLALLRKRCGAGRWRSLRPGKAGAGSRIRMIK